ncbi:hypothetical protein [Novosphingobium sp. 9]|uniref:hypothetical protein n=1 Tax=Novosphingobium sp. 9 TaxID=2025349 RepID=UPI0021B546D4|nr:hypothetical protein [Novosphingobium sp. 9]
MADKKTYTVHRSMHAAGKNYARGDTREMTEIDAAALVEAGALSLAGEDPKVRAATVNHTFGAATSAVNDGGYTTATGESVVVKKAAAKSAAKA